MTRSIMPEPKPKRAWLKKMGQKTRASWQTVKQKTRTQWNRLKQKTEFAVQKRQYQKRRPHLLRMAQNFLSDLNFERAAQLFGEMGFAEGARMARGEFERRQRETHSEEVLPLSVELGIARIEMKALYGFQQSEAFLTIEEQKPFRVLRNDLGQHLRQLHKYVYREKGPLEFQYKSRLALIYAEMGRRKPGEKYFNRAIAIAQELNTRNHGLEAVAVVRALGKDPIIQLGRIQRGKRHETSILDWNVVPIEKARKG